jgi:asparagine synthase (glutamine-hydrolysing)
VCGISGHLVRYGSPRAEIVLAMARELRHRGPDDMRLVHRPPLSLAFNRLAIIDPDGSWQPFTSHDRSLVLAVNGEIYNYRRLRRDLIGRGHVFSGRGDCEVLLHLYEERGPDAVHSLRGMFAFALWDERRGRLLLGRDRMGEKPLYVTEADDGVLFASEAKALIAAGVPVELNPRAISDYFHLEYVPEPTSILCGVRKVPAGHLLSIDTRPWCIQETAYWRLEDAEPCYGPPSETLGDVLTELAPLVVRADRPLGVALSGGLDSSIVAALATKYADHPPHAFAVGYSGRPANDERALAGSFATSLGMEFHEVELDPAAAVVLFPEVVSAWDEPIADLTGMCYFAVMRAASAAGVRVMLQGQGSDELFWGYPWVRAAMARTERTGRTVFYELNPDYMEARRHAAAYYGEAMRSTGGGPVFPPGPPDQLILTTYLRENGISQGDRLSMANSIELRLPFVDHHFVEAALGLRKARQDHSEPPKHRLRKAVRDILPTAIIERPKRSFSPPLRTWHAALFAAYGDVLPGGELVKRGVLSEHGARRLARSEFPPGAGSPLSLKALALELWCRRNLARQGRTV